MVTSSVVLRGGGGLEGRIMWRLNHLSSFHENQLTFFMKFGT